VDKLERLLTLTATLLTANRPLTAEELHERIDGYPESTASFRRAFERDKDDLREMGIPLVMDEVPNREIPTRGYRIDRDTYYLRDPGFTGEELAALRVAASLVQLGGLGSEGLWKFGGADDVAGGGGRGAGVRAGDVTMAELPSDRRLTPLFAAIADRASVRFRYGDDDRRVDPYRLEFQRGRWYLTGYDHLRSAERNYRVDRIAGEVEVGDAGSFDPPPVASPGAMSQPWEFGEGEPIAATVLVDADQAAWAMHALGPAAVTERRDDGSIVVALEVTNVDAFRSFVLELLDHAEVIGPAELRAAVVDWLRAQVKEEK
jgi:predicted DNA-binding transcriptional regulator YafY